MGPWVQQRSDFFDKLAWDIHEILRARRFEIEYVNPSKNIRCKLSPGYPYLGSGPRWICWLRGDGRYEYAEVRREVMDGNLLRELISGALREDPKSGVIKRTTEREDILKIRLGIPYKVRRINLIWLYGMAKESKGKYEPWGVSFISTDWVVGLKRVPFRGSLIPWGEVKILGPLSKYSRMMEELRKFLVRTLIAMKGKVPVGGF